MFVFLCLVCREIKKKLSKGNITLHVEVENVSVEFANILFGLFIPNSSNDEVTLYLTYYIFNYNNRLFIINFCQSGCCKNFSEKM
jgi:hypothetical protein